MGGCIIFKELFKPPLLIFCITVTGLAITLFAYSLSIEITHEKILNPDIKSWNIFYKSISALGVCLLPKLKESRKFEEIHQNSDDITHSDQMNITRVSFLTDSSLVIDGKLQTNYFVHVTVNAEELGFVKSNEKVTMNITVPLKNNENKMTCVTVVGPSHLLPDAEVNLPSCSQPKSPPKQELLLMSFSKLQEKASCPSKHYGTLKFEENENLNVYLSKMDTSLMQIHIFASSSILFAMILLVFVYSLLRKIWKGDKKYSNDPDMTPLES